ncbi:MAG: hypothetical protein ISR78_07545 [Spirochaetia bacterium]|nr:hypothetical protein [Spirochaetia bacterium]
MSNIFLLGRRHKQPKDIRQNPVRLFMNIVLGMIIIAGIIYIVFEFVIKPNIVINEVIISYEETSVPISDEIYTLADNFQGISFSAAAPRSLEAAFSGLEEILNAEISRSLSGKLSIVLSPRIPVCIIKNSNTSSQKSLDYHPVDADGVVYSASEKYINYFRMKVPVIEVASIEFLTGFRDKVPKNLLSSAYLLLSLQELDIDLFNLITKVKYDNNSSHNNASAFLRISESEIEFQLSHDLELQPFYDTIKSVVGISDSWKKKYSRIAVHNDAAICRL